MADTPFEQVAPAVAAPAAAEGAGLKRGAINVTGVVMQNIANIAPAIAALFTVQFIASYSGVTAPLAYLLGFFVTLCSGIVLAELAHHLPSSGSYFTYLSRTLDPRIGFLATWLYFFAFPLVGAQAGDAMGSTIEQVLKAEYGFTFPWWLFLVLALAVTAVACYPGVTVGIRVLFVLSCFEFAVVLILALWGLADPGPGGFNFDGFNPGNTPELGTFYLGITFAIFALTGWDAAAPMAEEAESPRKTVGRGVVLSIIIMGAFLVVVAWGIQIGWGTANLNGFVNSEENPGFVIAKRLWGSGWIIVLLALANSTIAVLISSMNASTRMWYRMAKVGALPRFLGEVHPRYRTPVNAIYLQTGISVALGLVLGVIWGEENVFSVLGLLFIFAVIPAWVLANLGVFRLYRREHPEEFSPLKHAIVPVVSTVGLLWVGYKSVWPLPPYPNSWAAPLVGIWLVIGIAILAYIHSRGYEAEFMKRAGEAMDESMPVSD
jgi:amino acid transporter